MALILNFDTSTEICSVNLAKNGKILFIRESSEEKSHASSLTVFIEQILGEANITVSQLDAVAVSMGPGSYTGLRIGVSTAKGLCYGSNVPFIAISTLQAMAMQLSNNTKLLKGLSDNIWFCPMIDARRMEVYTAFYDLQNTEQRKISAEILDDESFQSILNERIVLFFGNGSAKFKDVCKHKNAIFIDNIDTSSEGMVNLAEISFEKKKFEDIAYFEPFYLKDFIATIPKKKFF